MITRLMLGNLQNDATHLCEVARLAQELRDAWQLLSAQPVARAVLPAASEAVASGTRASVSFGAA
jgi:flagellin-specific chaperone FliS